MSFEGSVAIVTGAGSGIGRVVAQRFAERGAKVVVADRDGECARAVTREIEDADGIALAVEMDISIGEQVAHMAAEARESLGPIDVLVNNAASSVADGVVDMDESAWDNEIAVNLRGAFLCAQEALRDMIELGRGSIINVTSVNGLSGLGLEPYSAAKAGLISLTQNVAVRYGKDGVRANAVALGTIRTRYWQESDAPPELFERLRSWYPLGRVGEPEDVANAVLFLSSEEAAWITGTVLRVDGGLLAGSQRMSQELQEAHSGPQPSAERKHHR